MTNRAALPLALASFLCFAAVVVSLHPVEAQTGRREITDTVNSNGDAASLTNSRQATVATIDITGTFSETLTFNVVGTDADPVACTPTAGGAAVSTATAPGKFVCAVAGWNSINVTGSSYVSGAAIVRIAFGS